ncbi:DMT family transporter [Xylanimonas ulmi]|uniref:EamA-like transporter family protein n=1 Tax=Xylanimonas ulmi TaxID=228973 RepID=A0A4Q7M1I6_9MICO|nr:DMT family transporter [Xylanibacterium ulmi]RZS61101.1 EamA-like transporter family protein [Xylanibacterium ulmi]
MTKRGAVLFGALGLIWGIPYLLIRIAVADLSPAVIVLGRCVIGALVLAPFAVRSGDLRAVLRRWPAVLAYASVEIATAWWLLTDAERHITSSLAGLLVAAVPIFATALALMLRVERRLSALRVVGLLVGLAGVAALAGVDAAQGAALRPVLQVLVTALCYAVGPMIVARSLGGVSPVTVNAVALTFCAIVYTPFALATWPTAAPSGGALASVVALGLVPTALAFVLLFELIAEVGPAPATVITYLNQAVALVAGVTFLGEPITTGILVGFPLVLAGAFLATWRPRRARLAGAVAHTG